jgi:NitT/TauT family transport system substrate-binding protein
MPRMRGHALLAPVTGAPRPFGRRAALASIALALGVACTAPPAAGPAKPAGTAASPTSATAAPAESAAAPAPAPPAAARPPVTVRITDIQITSAAGSYVAAAKGYFKEEGIEAEFVPLGTSDQIPAVVSGDADVAGAAINAFLFNALARGLPLKMVADHGANLPGASAGGFVVRKDLMDSGAYQGPASVRGWKTASGSPGSTADVALDRFLTTGGLHRDDLDFVQMTYPDMLPAFANKAIDAAYYQEPFTTIAVERGLAARGPIAYDMYPYQQIAVVLFGERLANERDAGTRFLRAYTRGVRDYVRAFLDRDPAAFDEVVPILIERTSVKERALFERAIPSGLNPDPLPNVQSIVDDQEWFLTHGFVSQRVNVPDYVDLTLIEDVIRQLGSARR